MGVEPRTHLAVSPRDLHGSHGYSVELLAPLGISVGGLTYPSFNHCSAADDCRRPIPQRRTRWSGNLTRTPAGFGSFSLFSH